SILEEITKSVEKIYESIFELSNLAYFKSVVEPSVSPEKPHLLLQGIIKLVVDIENTIYHIAISNNHIFAKKRKDSNKALWTYVNSCHLLETSNTSLLNFLFLS
ncbi:hypothetical protein V8G54_018726, partial [Vigna mungo]